MKCNCHHFFHSLSLSLNLTYSLSLTHTNTAIIKINQLKRRRAITTKSSKQRRKNMNALLIVHFLMKPLFCLSSIYLPTYILHVIINNSCISIKSIKLASKYLILRSPRKRETRLRRSIRVDRKIEEDWSRQTLLIIHTLIVAPWDDKSYVMNEWTEWKI